MYVKGYGGKRQRAYIDQLQAGIGYIMRSITTIEKGTHVIL
jgi:hypothetical protein